MKDINNNGTSYPEIKSTTKSPHSGHIFDDIRADRGYCRFIGINLNMDSDGSFDNILIKNVHISGISKYKSYANTASGTIGIRLENVKVNGACLTQDGFSMQGKVEIVSKCD